MSSAAFSVASRLIERSGSRTVVGAWKQQVRTATKKAGGSSNNGRDSAGRRLGIKVWPGVHANAGSIIIRQRGTKFRPGENVGIGNDHTLFALKPGYVHFTRYEMNKRRHLVHIQDTP